MRRCVHVRYARLLVEHCIRARHVVSPSLKLQLAVELGDSQARTDASRVVGDEGPVLEAAGPARLVVQELRERADQRPEPAPALTDRHLGDPGSPDI